MTEGLTALLADHGFAFVPAGQPGAPTLEHIAELIEKYSNEVRAAGTDRNKMCTATAKLAHLGFAVRMWCRWQRGQQQRQSDSTPATVHPLHS